MMDQRTAPLEARSLQKRYGNIDAVSNVSFRTERGRVTGFLGPNGAGKTSTLRMLLGLAEPTSGDGLVEGRPYRELVDPVTVVGAALDADGFHPGRSGEAHLRMLSAAAGLPDTRAPVVLAQVGMESGDVRKRPVGTYSLGMRQRLSLAAALLGDPSVLVLDEPANGLDPAGIRWLRGFLRGFAAGGGTVLVSSHLLTEVQNVVDDVIVIGHGQLLAAAPIDDFVGTHRSLEDVYLDLTSGMETPR